MEDIPGAIGAATREWAKRVRAERLMLDGMDLIPTPDADVGTHAARCARVLGEIASAEANPLQRLSAEADRAAEGVIGRLLAIAIGAIAEHLLVELSGQGMAKGLAEAARRIEDALDDPRKGTIVTAAAEAADAAARATSAGEAASLAATAGDNALQRSAGAQPILVQARTVDAGGLVYVWWLQALAAAFTATEPEPEPFEAPDGYELVRGLRAVRHFTPAPVSPAHRRAILEAARWTGSSKNRQNWAFVTFDDPEARAELATAGSFTDPIRNATWAVALVRTPGGEDFDIGRVAQNMMLAASALGVASCPVTLHREERARAVLGLDADHHCRYAIAFGYPDRAADVAARRERRAQGWGGRKPADEVVFRRRMGGE